MKDIVESDELLASYITHLECLEDHDGVLRKGFMSSALLWKELPDVEEVDVLFPSRQGQILWDHIKNTTYVCLINFLLMFLSRLTTRFTLTTMAP
jgi:hypothetical protein